MIPAIVRGQENSFQGLDSPKHGYLSKLQATKWEEAMLTGNGKIGALVLGYPSQERIVFSHEKLFLPQNPPIKAPNYQEILPKVREKLLVGDHEGAVEIMLKAGEKVGIDDVIWTDPLIPACQLEIQELDPQDLLDYSKSVNYESGETNTAWTSSTGSFTRSVFASRTDDLIAMRITSDQPKGINVRIRLAQVPMAIEESDEEEEEEEEEEFSFEEVLESERSEILNDKLLRYTVSFKKDWKGSLKGFVLETFLTETDGQVTSDDEWLYIREATSLVTITKLNLSWSRPVPETTDVENFDYQSYDRLLDTHRKVHGEMFNRFQFSLVADRDRQMDYDELFLRKDDEQLHPRLVEQLVKSARYALISSTGDLPPSLQGIWGGTWLPAWSGDFTLNGNVPSAISSGFNTNFPEVIEAYMNYMSGFDDDFRTNAKDLYGSEGIYVPSRSSSSGKTYHYSGYFPHLFWFGGNSWTAQYFYDYWQYTRNEDVLVKTVIPFMLDAMRLYEKVLYQDESGKYHFIPSYSPEVGPLERHPLAINATMDVAGLKQLIRNLLTLVEEGRINTDKVSVWKKILKGLPDYEIDESGDLKEWIWPEYENDNRHRHASHLYPLFFEVDPEFQANKALRSAAKTAIEKRLQYRRDKDGAEMAFGLVQLGTAAAHIQDATHAFECVKWLCKSYWSPAYTSYHDPGEIFNTDISGGLPSVVTEMLVQSSSDKIHLLPALPEEWDQGRVLGVLTRSGVKVDLIWESNQTKSVTLTALKDTAVMLLVNGRKETVKLKANQPYQQSF